MDRFWGDCVAVEELCSRLCCWGVPSPSSKLPELPCRGGNALPSFACRDRSFACFLLRPWRRLMMISRILGRYRSRLWGEASWLSVSSRMVRSRSGTGPRSAVSIPMALKARQARLNSYPSRTYTSETSVSLACLRDHCVNISSSCFVATRRCVTLFSICESCLSACNIGQSITPTILPPGIQLPISPSHRK